MKKTIIICLIILFIFSPRLNANENIIDVQAENIGITDFLKEANKYSKDLLDENEIKSLYSGAISGDVSSNSIFKKILKIFSREFLNAISSVGLIIIVILIHSIIRAISDGLNNSSVSEMANYVSYILIVTIIMKNFAEIIVLIKNTINNLVAFVNCLAPILLALLATSGGIISSGILQPLILFFITLTANIITKIIIPLSLAAIAFSIVSNISDKVQITKLSKFINSSTAWILGIILTIFVGVTSLEGTLSKRCR